MFLHPSRVFFNSKRCFDIWVDPKIRRTLVHIMASNPDSGESSAARRSHQQSVLPIGELQPTHQRILVRALSNVWNTPSARIVYGQILDGVPVPALCRNKAAFRSLPIAHPAWKEHREFCLGVMDKLKGFREQKDLTKLKLDSQVHITDFSPLVIVLFSPLVSNN
jgi:hypothetical protein